MSDVRELLGREVDPEEYEAIRELWKRHSLAEDARDLPGLISTLTEDCVYELPQTGQVWEGHEGAARFYTELLTAFPDIHFQLSDIVIGPQGVCEEARVTGTHAADWLDFSATGERVEFRVVIFFPWDREQRLFRGEKVYVDEGIGKGARG
jgi:predicted ester cyclase